MTTSAIDGVFGSGEYTVMITGCPISVTLHHRIYYIAVTVANT